MKIDPATGQIPPPLQYMALELSGKAPAEWAEFIRALARYRDDQVEHLAAAPIPEVVRMQGRAQGVSALLDILVKSRNNNSSSARPGREFKP